MDKDKVLNLAKLSRIKLSDSEAESLSHEFEDILKYVGEVREVGSKKQEVRGKEEYPIQNIMREDLEGHESGVYTEKILNQVPSREGNYIKVKKIL